MRIRDRKKKNNAGKDIVSVPNGKNGTKIYGALRQVSGLKAHKPPNQDKEKGNNQRKKQIHCE